MIIGCPSERGARAYVRRVVLGEAVKLPVDRKCTPIDPSIQEGGRFRSVEKCYRASLGEGYSRAHEERCYRQSRLEVCSGPRGGKPRGRERKLNREIECGTFWLKRGFWDPGCSGEKGREPAGMG